MDLALGENKPNQTQSKLAPSTAGGHCWELKKQSQPKPTLGHFGRKQADTGEAWL
jgi:hypothetical protein